jgi:hypothetical protein
MLESVWMLWDGSSFEDVDERKADRRSDRVCSGCWTRKSLTAALYFLMLYT